MGFVLVIDEADKAPVEVISILKGLLEDGEMELSDGRKITAASVDLGSKESGVRVGESGESRIIALHPSFRVIVLANRPGFPFLGNDFFRECGDIFSCHIISNPDFGSELALLQAYAPSLPAELLSTLIRAFNSLRARVEEGTFVYPYSSRELVNIAKHLHAYPNDGAKFIDLLTKLFMPMP